MTPAAIQARVFSGLIPGGEQAHCEKIARDLVTARRRSLEGTGWDLSYHAGSARPPQGAVLIGAVTCATPGECDINLYVYPVSPQAMVPRDRCGHEAKEPTHDVHLIEPHAVARPVRPPQADTRLVTGARYQLEYRYQDGNWVSVDGHGHKTLSAAMERAERLSRNGMARVIDTWATNGLIVIQTYSAGGGEVSYPCSTERRRCDDVD